jgi:hypothetical protein
MATYIITKLISEIGISALIGTATSLSNTSSSIYTILYKITNYSGPGKTHIINTIFELDMENSIRIIDSLLKEIPKDKINSLPVIQSIDSLNDIIKTISEELKVIYQRLHYNESLWVASSLRSFDCTKNLNRLKIYNNILEKRRKILFDILQIKHEISENTSSHLSSHISNQVFRYLNNIQKTTSINNNNKNPLFLDDSEKTINNNINIQENTI